MTPPPSSARVVLALLFFCGALFHAFALRNPSISIPEPEIEHLAFVFVNLLVGYLLVDTDAPPVIFYTLVGGLTGHQLLRHGPLLIDSMKAGAKFDMQSFSALAMVFALWSLILAEVRDE